MIPRTKVNYGIRDLINAVFVKENGLYCGELAEILSKMFQGYRVLLTPSGRGALYLLLSVYC